MTKLFAIGVVIVALVCVLASPSNQVFAKADLEENAMQYDVASALPLTNAMQDVSSTLGSIIDDVALTADSELGFLPQDQQHQEQHVLLETEADRKKGKRVVRRAARRALRKQRKLKRKLRKLRKAGKGRKARKLRRKLRKLRRKSKKSRKARKSRKLRKSRKVRKARKARKAKARKAKKLRRKLRKLKRKARKGLKGRKGKKLQRKLRKLRRKSRKARKGLKKKSRKALSPYEKRLAKNDKKATAFEGATFKARNTIESTIGAAARLDINVGDLRDKQKKVLAHKAHYERVKKRFFAAQKKREQRKKEMAKVKKYKGKLQVGNGKQAKNHMTGGPMTKPSRNLSSLEKYQLKVLEREAKRQDNPNQYRAQIVKKIRDLYTKAKPKMGGFMMALLQQYGVKTNEKEAKLKWTKAKNRYVQKLRLRAEKKWLKEQEKLAKKEKDAKETKAALALIAQMNKKTGKKGPVKLAKDPNWLEEYPKNKRKLNWWGCIDCDPKTSKQKLPLSKKDAKKKAKAAKKLGKKAAKGKVNLRERTLSTGKKVIVPKNLPIPKYDPTPRNAGILQSLLEEYKVNKSQGEVKMAARQLMKTMRTAIVMSMLSEKESQEILKAKTEELEKVVATKAKFPVMVKHKIPHYKPNSKIPFPDIREGSIREDPRTMDWEVDVVSANGYLEKHWRTDRHSIDFGDQLHQNARRDHEAFMKRYQILPDKIVWRQFEGKDGDSTQRRHEEVNQWRKKNPNMPLEDGTEPW